MSLPGPQESPQDQWPGRAQPSRVRENDQSGSRHYRRLRHLRPAGARKCARAETIKSPWGEPSAPLRVGEIAGLPIVFLPRHDKGHRLSPSDINYRANIDVLKRAGVTDLVSLSACGSFKEELPPGTFVLIDQFVDRTYKRESSFFGKGCVAHVSMAHPVSPRLRIHLAAAAEAEGIARGARRHLCLHGGAAILHAMPRA